MAYKSSQQKRQLQKEINPTFHIFSNGKTEIETMRYIQPKTYELTDKKTIERCIFQGILYSGLNLNSYM